MDGSLDPVSGIGDGVLFSISISICIDWIKIDIWTFGKIAQGSEHLKSGLKTLYITSLGRKRYSIYLKLGDIWFFGWHICNILFGLPPLHIVYPII
jgi:hypothetical protein